MSDNTYKPYEPFLFVLQPTPHGAAFTVIKFLEKDAVERKLQVGDLVNFDFAGRKPENNEAVVTDVHYHPWTGTTIKLKPTRWAVGIFEPI